MYFLRLLDIVSADSDTLVEVLIPPPEGGGELLFADVSQDPIPGQLDRLLGQPEAPQHLLHSSEEELVHQSQIQQIRGRFEHLDLVVSQSLPHFGGSLNWRNVPVKNAALLHQLRPYIAKNLQETVEGIHSEGGVDRLPLLDHLGVDDPVGVKEGEDPLLHVASMHPLPKLGLAIPF